MEHQPEIVISASRRTDIPAFYMDWFMDGINRGYFEVINPYNGHKSIVPATPDRVHTIVFWSKNFGAFIKKQCGEKLLGGGYNLFFNFTINSDSPLLEPEVSPVEKRLDQLDSLCAKFDARNIAWRFDPLCFYKKRNKKIYDNMGDFSMIASRASASGVKRCVTSFMDDYGKIQKRVAAMPGFSFIDPDMKEKIKIVLQMENELLSKGIDLYTCCEKELMEALLPESSIKKNSCIPKIKLSDGSLFLKKDRGQRIKKGCGCMLSFDIGSYRLHPCYHNCLFCYANPVLPK